MKHLYLVAIILTSTICYSSLNAQNINNKHSDGLLRSTPETEGIRSEGILNFLESVEKDSIELHSFMLLRNGKVVTEGYWNPFRADTYQIMYSVSKTYTSTAIGFAVAENRIALNDKVISFFPEYDTPEVDSYTKELTIRNLLTMTAGKEPYENFRLRDSNWTKAFFNVDRDQETKDKFDYNSYATFMLSAVLQKVTGETVLEYLKPRLLDPLGIQNITSEQSPTGIDCGGWGMHVKTSDMAKLGQLYLQKGKWNGKQLLPANWIEEASKLQVETGGNLTNKQKESSDWAHGYGYCMWVCRNNAYRADGAFGQLIIIMPEQEAVVAITAKTHDMQKELQLVWDHILPAITKGKLRDNKEVHNKLSEKLESLKIKTLQPEEKNSSKNITKTYTLANNTLDYQSIRIKLKDGTCDFTIRTNTATHNFRSSTDQWHLNKTDKNSPYFTAKYRNPIGLQNTSVAGNYTWEKENILHIKLLHTDDSSHENYRIVFENNKIALFISDSENPNKTPLRIVGYAE